MASESAQSAKPSVIEFTDILLTTALPLHPYLAAHPRLSVAVIEDEDVLAETHVVNGDLTAGIWQLNSSLSANSDKQSVTLAVVASENGAKMRFASVTLSVAEVLTRIQARPDGYQEFAIDSGSIRLVMTFLVNVLPSLIVNNPPSHVGTHDNHSVDSRTRSTQSSPEPDSSELPSREDLESAYANVILIPDQDEKAQVLSLLGGGYYGYYQETRAKADLERAISMHEEAMQWTGLLHPQLAEHAHGLAVVLTERFKQSGDPFDVERAISHYQTAVDATDDLDEDKPGRLCNLGNALEQRFQRFGDLSDLDSAITFKRKGVELASDGHPNSLALFNNLGKALQARFEHLGNLTDLEDAISNKQKAVELVPDGHPNRPALFNNLGNSLQARFEHLGNLTDLEDAISSNRKAVKLTPNGHPDEPIWLNDFGSALQARFEYLGSLADLEDAISNRRRAIELTPDGHPNSPAIFNNLGITLQIRFEHLGSLTDLEDTISNMRKAVKLTPNGHPDKPGRLSNLGNALHVHFNHLGSLTDLEDAISNRRKAVELTPNGHPNEPGQLNNLRAALQTRFEHLGSLTDLEDAISSNRKAVGLTPNGLPDKPGWLNNLGNTLLSRFRRLGILGDLESALSAFSTAANSSGSAMVRFKAARRWAKVAEEHSRSPLDAFGCALDLLPRIAWLGLAVTDQHALLANVGSIVRDAVAAAIRYEEYETAIVWAEQGRSIVWQNLLGLRNPVDSLREAYPELANRLQRIAAQLEGSESHEPLGGKEQATPAQEVSHKYSKLALEWENLVEEIRSLPTFEGFLKAKTFCQLAPVAHEGPVVVLNINDVRCDALVLIADDSVERNVSAFSIPLERFSQEKIKRMFESLTELLSSAGVRERNDRKTGRAQSRMDSDAKFKVILRILWQDVVKPVIGGLAFRPESTRPPRIWWCTTGVLAFLPIHAAGVYDTQEVGEKVSDYVVSSYTPTLTAILELSDPVVQTDFQVLTVAQASAPGAPPIPKTEDEVKILWLAHGS